MNHIQKKNVEVQNEQAFYINEVIDIHQMFYKWKYDKLLVIHLSIYAEQFF
jgi:hypothetical protein